MIKLSKFLQQLLSISGVLFPTIKLRMAEIIPVVPKYTSGAEPDPDNTGVGN